MSKIVRLLASKGFRLIGLGLAMLLLALALSVGPVIQAASVTSNGFVNNVNSEDITFAKTFVPNTIGPESVTTLRFDIANENQAEPVANLAFTDTLPTNVTIAALANIVTTCPDSQVLAPAGGDTITFTGDRLGANSVCFVTVDVTSSVVGVHRNISDDLISDAGNSGNATADLIVSTSLPGFTKRFMPDTISSGGRSTLTFTIDNTANQTDVSNLAFVDMLPLGMTVADPANASTDCAGGIITAVPGTAVINYTTPFSFPPSVVDAGTSCTISVDVIGTGSIPLGNTTSELVSSTGSSGKASAILSVTTDALAFSKSFTDDPVPSGYTTTLEFTIENLDRVDAATDISFTDDLNATLSGLVAVGLPLNNPCGSGSQLTGTDLITLTGGNLPAEGSCTFNVTLQTPSAAEIGVYANTTSSITGDVGGMMVTGSPAADLLFVQPVPILTKEFINDPVGTGDTVTITFSITNSSLISDASNIVFTDELTTFFPFGNSVTLPSEPCGVGSSISLIPITEDREHLSLIGGTLGPDTSCTFDVGLDIPIGVASGVYTNTTEAVTAVLGNITYIGKPASDSMIIASAPRLQKEFTDDPILPGDTVTLAFTITNEDTIQSTTGISFTDDLDATLMGLTAVGLPTSDVCGAGSAIDGTSSLSFTGGTLAPSATCTFSVTLQVPVAALPGNHTNTTSGITATVGGVAVTGNPAEDDLQVAGLTFTKSFADDPVIIPGETVTLTFIISNTSQTANVTSMIFSDDLDNVLSGLVAVAPLPTEPCGVGSTLSGTTSLSFNGGNLAPQTSCSFDVMVQVPGGAASGTYVNTTSNLIAFVDSSVVFLDPAKDGLTISSDLLLFSKTFTDDPAAPGDTVTLEFTITNTHTVQNAVDITFSDDLTAVLAGLTAVGLPDTDICGMGSQIDGTTNLSFTGGNLAPGASCTFSVSLQIPANAPVGTYANTTSSATGLINGFPVTGDPAIGDLKINVLTLAKSFDGATTAGGKPILAFTIENLDVNTGADEISFSDNLDDVLSGLVATGLPVSDVCGSGSQLAGTSILTLSDGNLGPGETCTFSVPLKVPGGALPGDYLNTTSELLVADLPVSDPAKATMTVNPSIYLPIILNDFTSAPDLVVTSLSVSSGNVQVVIENQGNTAVIDEFWVDVYIDPTSPPTMVNQTWSQLADEGLVWGVTGSALPLAPGDSMVLTLNDAYYRSDLSAFSGTVAPGTAVYAQVDSADAATTYGAVQEIHEINGDPYNNIFGTTATDAGAPAIIWLAFQGDFVAQYRLPERP